MENRTAHFINVSHDRIATRQALIKCLKQNLSEDVSDQLVRHLRSLADDEVKELADYRVVYLITPRIRLSLHNEDGEAGQTCSIYFGDAERPDKHGVKECVQASPKQLLTPSLITSPWVAEKVSPGISTPYWLGMTSVALSVAAYQMTSVDWKALGADGAISPVFWEMAGISFWSGLTSVGSSLFGYTGMIGMTSVFSYLTYLKLK